MTLKDMKTTNKPPSWRHPTWAERLNTAATALALWGLLTSSERERVHQRLMKRIGKDSKAKDAG